MTQFETSVDEMFFLLGRVTGMLLRPAYVEELKTALADPGGGNTRARLLQLHVILGDVLAVAPSTSSTQH